MKDPDDPLDPDGDGVERELSVGDITAIVIYCAAQEEPTTVDRMVTDGLMAAPGEAFAAAARRGRELFDELDCTSCHTQRLVLDDPIFEEPTLRGAGKFFDPEIDPDQTALDPSSPFRFHLGQEGDIPRPVPNAEGKLSLELFGDMRRHNMGSHLADAQPTPVRDASGAVLQISGSDVFVEPAVFLTPELWESAAPGPGCTMDGPEPWRRRFCSTVSTRRLLSAIRHAAKLKSPRRFHHKERIRPRGGGHLSPQPHPLRRGGR